MVGEELKDGVPEGAEELHVHIAEADDFARMVADRVADELQLEVECRTPLRRAPAAVSRGRIKRALDEDGLHIRGKRRQEPLVAKPRELGAVDGNYLH